MDINADVNALAEAVTVSDNPDLLDEPFTYQYLRDNMYWAKSLTYEAFVRSVQHSAVVFGVYESGWQIGFARVVSDCATFAYLTDVFIVENYRGQGLSRRLMEAVTGHPKLQGLRRFLLVTEDAGGLYAKFGFEPLADGGHWMQILRE